MAIQLNDTHPALAVAGADAGPGRRERTGLGRGLGHHPRPCAYTNHTLLPEALEKWPVRLLERVLPRHLQIIYEINRPLPRARSPPATRTTADRLRRMSIIEEGAAKQVRMAHLAIVGSHSVNGVAALHTEFLKTALFRDFYAAVAGTLQQQDQRHHASGAGSDTPTPAWPG